MDVPDFAGGAAALVIAEATDAEPAVLAEATELDEASAALADDETALVVAAAGTDTLPAELVAAVVAVVLGVPPPQADSSPIATAEWAARDKRRRREIGRTRLWIDILMGELLMSMPCGRQLS